MRSLFLKYIAQTSPEPMMLEIVSAEGVYLYDRDNKPYIDLISGISVSNLGHGNENVRKAIHEQTDRYLHTMVFGEYVQSPQVRLAERLTELLPPGLNSVYFVNSGSEAIEGALKLAKRHTGKPGMVAMNEAYHGGTHGALSLMSNAYFTGKFRPLVPGITFIDLNDHSQIDRIDDQVAGVFVELVQAESGYNPAEKDFIRALRKKCDQTGSLLIFDEIQTGMGRTGSLFAFEQFDVVPDVLCLAKAFGGGMPLGAFITDQRIMASLSDEPVLGHITTFGGHPVSCAASVTALNEILENDLISAVEEKATRFRSQLKHPEIIKLRGKGLMMSVELKSRDFLRQVVTRCIRKGLIIDWFLFRENYLRIAPPLVISNEEIDRACSIILESLDESE